MKNVTKSFYRWMDLAGLVIIGFGTGGIKPCVSAFGGDQFEVGQVGFRTITHQRISLRSPFTLDFY